MTQASKPIVTVEYEGVNISADLSGYLIETLYKDNVHGKADEVELTLDDSQGLFQNAWYPDKKAVIRVTISHQGQDLNCGTFYIGDINFSFPPDIVKWHGTSVDPNSTLRTKKSKSYNQVSLLQIAKVIAADQGLQVDDGTKTITIQHPKTDEEQAKLTKLAELFLKHSNEPNNVFFYNALSALQVELLKVIQSLEAKGYSAQATKLRTGVGEFLTDKSSQEATENTTQNAAQKTRLGASKMSALLSQVKKELILSPTQHTRTLGLGLSKIMVEQSTQNNKTDLEYLKTLANKYGLFFNIKPPYMVFYSAFQLNGAPSIATIHKADIISGEITDKIHGTYSDVNVSSHNPNENETITNATELQNTAAEQQQLLFLRTYITQATQQDQLTRQAIIRKAAETNNKVLKSLNEKGFGEEYEALLGAYSLLLVSGTVTACVRFANFCRDLRTALLKIQAQGNKVSKDKDSYAGGQSKNTLVVRTKVESKEQADALAKAALYNANSETRTGSLTVPGNLLLVAGSNFDLTGAGRLSQKYSIVSSAHLISNGGQYTTAIDYKAGPIVDK